MNEYPKYFKPINNKFAGIKYWVITKDEYGDIFITYVTRKTSEKYQSIYKEEDFENRLSKNITQIDISEVVLM